jgi:peroxiredoxin
MNVFKDKEARYSLGDILPSFKLPDASGGEFSMWDLKGRENMVIFVFDAVCGPECSHLLQEVSKRYQDYREQNAEVIAIFRTNRESADDIRHELNLPFYVLADADGSVSAKLVNTTPAVIVSDRFGEVMEILFGDDVWRVSQDRLLTRVELNELACPE